MRIKNSPPKDYSAYERETRSKKRKSDADESKWLWKEYTKKSSRLGRRYQVSNIPKPCQNTENSESG